MQNQNLKTCRMQFRGQILTSTRVSGSFNPPHHPQKGGYDMAPPGYAHSVPQGPSFRIPKQALQSTRTPTRGPGLDPTHRPSPPKVVITVGGYAPVLQRELHAEVLLECGKTVCCERWIAGSSKAVIPDYERAKSTQSTRSRGGVWGRGRGHQARTCSVTYFHQGQAPISITVTILLYACSSPTPIYIVSRTPPVVLPLLQLSPSYAAIGFVLKDIEHTARQDANQEAVQDSLHGTSDMSENE